MTLKKDVLYLSREGKTELAERIKQTIYKFSDLGNVEKQKEFLVKINALLNDERRSVVLPKINIPGVVDIGNYVEMLLSYDNGNADHFVVKLSGAYNIDEEEAVPEFSVNDSLGRVIYGLSEGSIANANLYGTDLRVEVIKTGKSLDSLKKNNNLIKTRKGE